MTRCRWTKALVRPCPIKRSGRHTQHSAFKPGRRVQNGRASAPAEPQSWLRGSEGISPTRTPLPFRTVAKNRNRPLSVLPLTIAAARVEPWPSDDMHAARVEPRPPENFALPKTSPSRKKPPFQKPRPHARSVGFCSEVSGAEAFGPDGKAIIFDGPPHASHQILVKVQVVERCKSPVERFIGKQQVPQIGTAVTA